MFAAARFAKHRTRLDRAVIASVLLVLAMNLVAVYGDLGPSVAYASVPM